MKVDRALTISMAACAEESAKFRLSQMHPRDYRMLLAEELERARQILNECRKAS